MGLTDLVFSENGCIADRVSNTLLGGAGGVTRELTRFFLTLGARRTGHGARARARLAVGGPSVNSPSAEPSGAEIGRPRPARKRPSGRKDTILLCHMFGTYYIRILLSVCIS